MREALAVYYFPGMWEWDRTLVRSLAHAGFRRSLEAHGGDPALAEHGARVLDRYFDWAVGVDDFVPVRVATDFDVTVPDPLTSGRDLATPSGEAVRYQGRIDLLVVDDDDHYWVVEHAPTTEGWADLDDLLLHERTTSHCWAWELFYMGMRIAGVIHNELRLDAGDEGVDDDGPPPAAAPAHGGGHRRMYVRSGGPPHGITVTTYGQAFRRTRIPRGEDELRAHRTRLGLEVLDMVDPGLSVYPSPSPPNCGSCAYRAPCVATDAGGGVEEILARSYRRKPPEELVEGRLGGVTWAMGRGAAPPKFKRDT